MLGIPRAGARPPPRPVHKEAAGHKPLPYGASIGGPLFELLHPAPVAFVLVAGSGFLAAAYRGWPPIERLAPFLLALLLTQLAISLHNDYCDRELDAATKPWRALPRGVISPEALLTGAGALCIGGLLVAALLGPSVTGLVALGTAAGFAYNAWLKGTLWSWLPFWVALPSLPLCAFLAAERFEPALALGYLIGAPLVVAVHLADALPDVESDGAFGVRGLAHRLGPQRTWLTCQVLLGLALALVAATGQGDRPMGPLVLALLGLLILGSCPWTQRWRSVGVFTAATALGVGWTAGLLS